MCMHVSCIYIRTYVHICRAKGGCAEFCWTGKEEGAGPARVGNSRVLARQTWVTRGRRAVVRLENKFPAQVHAMLTCGGSPFPRTYDTYVHTG